MMSQQVWGKSNLICTPHGALENWAYPYKSQIWKFWNIGVVIHPELYFKILRPMVKELAQSNLPCLSYGKNLSFICNISKCYKNDSYLVITSKL